MKKEKLILYIIPTIFFLIIAIIFEIGYKNTIENYTKLYSIDKDELSMSVGDKSQINVITKPSDVSSEDLKWKSSDENVAIVNQDGEIIAKNPGTVEIILQNDEGQTVGKSKIKIVDVGEKILVSSIVTSSLYKEVNVGESYSISASVLPVNATNKNLIWSTDNDAIATVDSNGNVLAKKVGIANITISTTDDSNKKVVVKINVVAIPIQKIYVNKITTNNLSVKIETNGQLQLYAEASPINATNKSLIWKINDVSLASISNTGLLVAKAPGQTTVDIIAADGSNVKTTINLTIYKKYDPLNIYLDPNGKDTANGLSETTPILSLTKAQEILKTMAINPTVKLGNINIIIKEGKYYGQKVIWDYVNPSYKITFKARDTTKLPVFVGDVGNTDTWFFVNYIGKSNISFRYIRVENYFTAMAFKGNHLVSSRANSDNLIFGMYFYNIGDKYTNPTDIFKSSDAVIRLSNSKNNIIENSHFVNCGNRGLVSGAAPIHAVYMGHYSSNNKILRSKFTNVTSDPIRLRNGSDNNIIDGNTFEKTGSRAYVSEWYCYNISNCSTGLKTNETRSIGNVFKNNKLIGEVVGNKINGGYNGKAITQTFIIIPNIESSKEIITYYDNKCGTNVLEPYNCPIQVN